MAATAAVLNLLSAGDHVVVTDDLYGGTYRLFSHVLTRYGLEFTYVDMSDLAAVRERDPAEHQTASGSKRRPIRCSSSIDIARDRAPLVGALGDAAARGRRQHVRNALLSAAARAWRRRGRPLDDEVHRRPQRRRRRRRHHERPRARTTRIKFHQNAVGGVPGPHDAWLTMRGAKTLAIRMREHARNAQPVAEFLAVARGRRPRVLSGAAVAPATRAGASGK